MPSVRLFGAAGLLALTAALTAGAASAQTTAATPAAPESATVEQVVVTASPFPITESSAVSSVEVLTRADLDLAPNVGLGDLLNGLPGVRSTAYGPGASRPVIRGQSGPRVLVLQNGIGQIDVSDVSPDHAVATDTGTAERVEVLRGPSSILYGGSGIGGVVNVLDDRVPSARGDRPVEGRVGGYGSTVDDGLNAAARVKLSAEGPLVFSFDASWRNSASYDIPGRALTERFQAANGVAPSDDDRLRNTDVTETIYGGGVSYVGERGYLGVALRRIDSDYGIPYPQIDGAPAGGDEGPIGIDLRQNRVDSRGEYRLDGGGPFAALRYSAGYGDYRHAEVLRDTGEQGTVFTAEGVEGRFELVQRDRNGWNGAVGVQGLDRTYEAVGDEAFVPKTDIDELGLFTLQRVDRGGYGFEVGARVDRRTLDSATAERKFTAVSGAAGLFLRPTAGLFLGLNVSHNERAPNEVELFADGPHLATFAYEVGDPTFGKEKLNQVEATARYTVGRLRLEAHAYHARYDGYIEERPTGGFDPGEDPTDPADDLPIFAFTQSDARFTGGELEVGFDLVDDGVRTLTLEGAADVVRGRIEGGLRPARIPPWGVTGRLVYADPTFGGQLEVRRVGEQNRVSGFEAPTDGYTVVNALLSVKPLADKGIKLFAEGRNLLDEEVREHASFLKEFAPQPGRNLRFGVAYEF